MKAPEFAYERATSVTHALEVLERHGAAARVLAGGQSLLPTLNMRLQYPDVVIDISRLADLRGIAVGATTVRIGALTRHADLLASAPLAKACPLIVAAAQHIAHPAIRNRGTIGGSLALADPAAELPAVLLALAGTVVAASRRGERRIPATEFFKGLYDTALGPDEMLTAVELPVIKSGERDVFKELARREGDYAMVGVAARARVSGRRLSAVSLAFLAVGDRPFRARKAADMLVAGDLDAARNAAALAALRAELPDFADLNCSAETRKHLAGVLLKRVVQDFEGQ